MDDQPERIPQHRHCHNCGKAFIGDGEFCGDDCKNSAGKVAKKKLRTLLLVWLVIVCVTISLSAVYYLHLV